MLEIKNVFKSYDNKEYAIKDINLEIDEGDIFAFIGKNGAGKTTLLKAIAGIHTYEKGEILLDGESNTNDLIKFKSQIAYIPDNPDIYESMTGIEFLNFICDAFNVDVEVRKERVEKWSEFLDIKDALGKKVATYSHGMKQKLAIISALVHEPKLLLLDEPFVGLDPEASFKLKNVFKEFASEGRMIFFSTHVLETAEKICNKVAIIMNGEIVTSGSMEEVKKNDSLESVFLELVENA